MPTKEGIETIRELHRDYSELPIIAISGGGRFGASDFLPHAEMFGAHAVLRKPFSVDEVIATVDALLGADGTSPCRQRSWTPCLREAARLIPAQ